MPNGSWPPTSVTYTELARLFEPGPTTSPPPVSYTEGGSLVGEVAPGYGADPLDFSFRDQLCVLSSDPGPTRGGDLITFANTGGLQVVSGVWAGWA